MLILVLRRHCPDVIVLAALRRESNGFGGPEQCPAVTRAFPLSNIRLADSGGVR